jgi:hypothetical protein
VKWHVGKVGRLAAKECVFLKLFSVEICEVKTANIAEYHIY